jgi:trehalose 6-phosphate synthase
MLRLQAPGAYSVWSRARLRDWIAKRFNGESIVVLSNREPYHHDRSEGARDIGAKRSSGGLVTALEPVVETCSGVWVAHGSGAADRLVVDDRDCVAIPPENPRYRVRRVWLDDLEARGSCQAFANEAMWPLCHRAFVQPVFRADDFRMYRAVNARFADAVCEEVDSDRPLILVQDYHFALAPRLLRQRLPLATIVAFWHVPWPTPQDFAICPWGREMLDGLLGSTLIGFQTVDDRARFRETVQRCLHAESRRKDVIEYKGRPTGIGAYPVSIEWPNRLAVDAPSVERCRHEVRRRLGIARDVKIVLGVDRLDYTKGINEKLLAAEHLLASRPELRGRVVFVQIAEPTRASVAAYREVRSRVRATAERINGRFGCDGYVPIVLLESRHEPDQVYRFLRAADVGYVGSLHDGMNLVAKEFVSARTDCGGVLVLSEFTGAARELGAALMVNPYDVEGSAAQLGRALTMSPEEQAGRMSVLRAVVAEFNAFRWAADLLQDAARLRTHGAQPSGASSRSYPREGRSVGPAVAHDSFLPISPQVP